MTRTVAAAPAAAVRTWRGDRARSALGCIDRFEASAH
jgi:hypothetical protein